MPIDPSDDYAATSPNVTTSQAQAKVIVPLPQSPPAQ